MGRGRHRCIRNGIGNRRGRRQGQRIKRECLLGLKDCDDASACVMHCDWKPIKQELTENLGRYTLATLASGEMPSWLGSI